MKFVCDRCQTRYSIADDKVRGKILKVRCKSCQNVITVRETGVAGPDVSVVDAPEDRTVLANFPPAAAPSVARPADSHRPAPTAPQRPLTPPPAPPPAAAPPDLIQWFMALEGKQSGPYSRKGLLDKLAAMPPGADVHVWNERMDGWKPPEQVPSLARELQSRRRPVPPLPGAGHPGTHPVPGVPGRTTTGSQPVVPVAATGGRRQSRSLPIPAGSANGPGGGHEALPLAAAAAEPGANGAHAGATRTRPAAAKAGGGLGALNGGAGGAVAPAMVPLTLDPNDVPEMPDDPGAEGVASTLAPTAGTDVAHPSANWQSTSVPLVATPGRNRSTKLILGSLGIVTVVVVLVTFALTRRVPAPSVIAEKPKATATAGDDFNKLADQLAQEKAKEVAVVNGPPSPTIALVPIEPPRESTAVVRGTKNSKGKKGNRRGGGRGATQVTPPAFTGGAPGAAVPDSSGPTTGSFGGPERKVGPVGGGGGTHSTPSQAEIARVINNNKAGIKVCYQRALLRDSSLTHGKIVVKLTLGLSGRVKSVNIDGPQPFLALQPCIKEMVSRWGFPPSSEEYGTEFAYVFQGNE